VAKRQGPIISVFGGSRIAPGTEAYEAARRLGHLLARAGYIVCNGGYDGAMEATARGAKEAGGYTIGVTLRAFEPYAPNPFLDEEERAATLLARLERLTALGEGYVVLLGAIGTLLELALVWNLSVIGAAPGKPIVVVGAQWRRTLDAMRQHLLVRDVDLASLTLVETPDEAVAALDEALRGARKRPDRLPDGNA